MTASLQLYSTLDIPSEFSYTVIKTIAVLSQISNFSDKWQSLKQFEANLYSTFLSLLVRSRYFPAFTVLKKM